MARAPSCAAILASDPDALSGTYTIENPDGGGTLDVYCDMQTDDGGWTLVYKIAGASDMASTGAVNAEGLAQADGSLESDGSGKLSDVAIRSLCTEQYRVVSRESAHTPLFCTFDDIAQYGDNVQYTGKDCSLSYNPTGRYPDVSIGKLGHKWWDHRPGGRSGWGTWVPATGFSTWSFPGAVILQKHYWQSIHWETAFNFRGSQCYDCTSELVPSCGASGACYSQVWCRPEDELSGTPGAMACSCLL
jgi:hypothetical protein